MNIKIPKEKRIKRLFEDSQGESIEINEMQSGVIGAPDVQKLDKKDRIYAEILSVKSKQFKFDNGGIMGNINTSNGTKFCLSWHKVNTNSFEEFVQSVQNFIAVGETKLTQGDIGRLKIEYNKNKN